MYDSGNARASYPMPERTPEVESEIVSAAKGYEEACRELHHLQAERDKIEEMIKQTIHRQEEFCRRIGAIIHPANKPQY